MDQTTLGIGTRLQHTQYGPGVIVGVKYAVYQISFIHHGIKEIDKNDPHLDEIIAENVTEEIETHSETERSLLKILRLWNGISEIVPLGDKWKGGTLNLQSADKSIKPKEIPIDIFFHKIVMARDRLTGTRTTDQRPQDPQRRRQDQPPAIYYPDLRFVHNVQRIIQK
jgi:hypothetical protein